MAGWVEEGLVVVWMEGWGVGGRVGMDWVEMAAAG